MLRSQSEESIFIDQTAKANKEAIRMHDEGIKIIFNCNLQLPEPQNIRSLAPQDKRPLKVKCIRSAQKKRLKVSWVQQHHDLLQKWQWIMHLCSLHVVLIYCFVITCGEITRNCCINKSFSPRFLFHSHTMLLCCWYYPNLHENVSWFLQSDNLSSISSCEPSKKFNKNDFIPHKND